MSDTLEGLQLQLNVPKASTDERRLSAQCLKVRRHGMQRHGGTRSFEVRTLEKITRNTRVIGVPTCIRKRNTAKHGQETWTQPSQTHTLTRAPNYLSRKALSRRYNSTLGKDGME